MSALHTVNSWVNTKKAHYKSTTQLAARREKLWQKLQPALARTPALADLSGRPLYDFPILEAAQIRQDIGQWNSLRINHSEAQEAAETAERGVSQLLPHGTSAGYSTGTIEARGIFLSSPKERAIYLGQALAKLLPLSALLNPSILLFLRADNALYHSNLLRITHCPLNLTPAEKKRIAERCNPTIMIAPPHVLAELVREGVQLPKLKHCFYGAEPIGTLERTWMAQHFGTSPQPIYQATEGFLAAPCRYGQLHLNEDSLVIEWQEVPGTSGHQIIVTDLQRHSQPMIRVKLDDFIERDDTTCPCGFAGAKILPVAGRIQDIWRYGPQTITPRQITDLLANIVGPSAEWKAIGTPNGIELQLATSTPQELATNAVAALSRIAPTQVHTLHTIHYPKRRRVEWRAT